MPTVGGLLIAASIAFGFYGLIQATNSGPLSEVNLGDVNVSIAFFGVAFLWGLLGTALIISGTVKNAQHHKSEEKAKEN